MGKLKLTHQDSPKWRAEDVILLAAMDPNGSDPPDRDESNRLEPNIEKLAELQLNTSAHIETLIGIVERLNERQEHFITITGQKIAALEEAQEQTQQNVNALIKIVDELIRNPHPE